MKFREKILTEKGGRRWLILGIQDSKTLVLAIELAVLRGQDYNQTVNDDLEFSSQKNVSNYSNFQMKAVKMKRHYFPRKT